MSLDLLNELLESAITGQKGPVMEPVKPQGPTGVGKFLSDVLAGASGTFGASEAEAFSREGLPNLRGIPKENIQQVLSEPGRQANIESLRASMEDKPFNRVLKIAQAQKALADAKIAQRLAGVKDNDELKKLLELYLKGQQATGLEGSIGQDPAIVETTKQLTQAVGEKAKQRLGIKPQKALKADTSKYSATATDAKGNTIGYNPKTKKWEPVK